MNFKDPICYPLLKIKKYHIYLKPFLFFHNHERKGGCCEAMISREKRKEKRQQRRVEKQRALKACKRGISRSITLMLPQWNEMLYPANEKGGTANNSITLENLRFRDIIDTSKGDWKWHTQMIRGITALHPHAFQPITEVETFRFRAKGFRSPYAISCTDNRPRLNAIKCSSTFVSSWNWFLLSLFFFK